MSAQTEENMAVVDKKAELSQRWPRDAPYIQCMGALKIFKSPWLRPQHFSQNF